MYADRVTYCPLVSHGEYADGTDRLTDGRMPDHYITLSAARRDQLQLKSDMKPTHVLFVTALAFLLSLAVMP